MPDYKVQAAIDRNFRKIGAMLEPLVSSERGEIEVLSYGDRVRVLVVQPFTSDSTKASRAIAELKILMGLQSSTSNVSDAIVQATSDLQTRPSNRRRIIVVLGESIQNPEDEKKLKDVSQPFCRSSSELGGLLSSCSLTIHPIWCLLGSSAFFRHRNSRKKVQCRWR